MKLYSTNNPENQVEFKEAVFNALPQDKGLYMPVNIPKIDPLFIQNIQQYSLPEIAFEVASVLLEGAIPSEDLKRIIQDAANFDAPLHFLTSDMAVLELFHGPSFAFKDFGARFMSRVMGFFTEKNEKTLEVLVATSGDTGGAVALGFLGVEGTRVTILYPKGKVSEIQELQLTTNGENIRAIEVEGTFDDCQALVKQAFVDEELNTKLRLTSANSINIARLIPQMFYYFYAYAQLKAQGVSKVVYTVPSGNFGNIGAGILASKMGLPVQHFVAANNANDTVTEFLKTGKYHSKASVQTLSNAMDVGNPSNWVRIMDMFDKDFLKVKKHISAYTFSDVQTKKAIAEVYEKYNYVLCPHTAVAYLAAKKYKAEHPGEYASVFLSTAHPCKFPEAYSEELFKKIETPSNVDSMGKKDKTTTTMSVDFEKFKNYLLNME